MSKKENYVRIIVRGILTKVKKGEKGMDIQKEKEEIRKLLDEVNASIEKEDIDNASKKELLEYIKLNLEIEKKLAVIDAWEKANKQ